ncbi:MAG: hypothetical protein HY858_03355 [Candidatus Solibacter usitatus]|nr:hypothetical protein [Candidatus Solibacter usitatus]
MPKAVSILFGALFTVAVAYSLGALLVQQLKAPFKREERPLFAFAAGSALLSLAMFLLAALHLVRDGVLLCAGAAALGAAWRLGAFRHEGERLPALPRAWAWLFWSLYATCATMCVLHAMAPEWSPDGSSYHLGVVAHYYRAHGFAKLTSNMYANLSQGVEMLFLHAWAFGRHSAAALVHCAFLLCLPLLMLRFGQRAGFPQAGAAAGLFTFLSPVMMVDGSSAYIDVAVACTLFALFYLCEIDAPPALIGVLAGACYAMKYTAFLALAYVVIRYAFKRRWRDLAVVVPAALVFILPWAARNWIWFGNPFSPLMNAWFPNPYVHVSFERDYGQWMRNYVGLESHWQLPLELTVRGQVLGGLLGPLFLLSPLALLGLRSGAGRRALAAAALFALPFGLNVGTRFLIPALPFVSFALAAGLPPIILPTLLSAHALLSFPDIPRNYCAPYAWRIADIPWRQALRIESGHSWLSEKFPQYRIARMVERAAGPDAMVFSFTPIAESYTSREIMVGFQSARGESIRDLILSALISDYQPTNQLEFTFPRQALKAVRVVQTAATGPRLTESRDIWSIGEFRVAGRGQTIIPGPEWRLEARPNPWDVQLAFDNLPLTRWRSWEWIRPGMYVRAEFGRALVLDTVRLEASPDQYTVRLRVDGQTDAGEWKTLATEPVATGLPPPLGLRRTAIEEARRRGVTHLLVAEGDFGWEDFRQKAGLWGIQEAGAVDNVRLYRIE